MKHREGHFTGPRDASIYYQIWSPDTPPRALIVLAHGAAEHSRRYERFAQHFVPHGYAIVAADQPGHGRSDGTPGYIERFDDFTATLDGLRAEVATEYAGVPQILLGHSMGGLVSTLYLLDHQQDFIGCVLSGPAIRTEVEPGLIQRTTIRVLSTLAPRSGVLQLDARGVSRDPVEVERYRNDPLNYTGKLSARFVAELFDAMQRIQARAREICLPLLMLHGGDDAMASPSGSQFLAAEVSSIDKTLTIYPGLYHEIFNEPEHEQVFADVLRWCEDRLAKTHSAGDAES
jgi:alpha-beta hydrolase superfamily lysophospholipase